jgi:hypothetical protein
LYTRIRGKMFATVPGMGYGVVLEGSARKAAI